MILLGMIALLVIGPKQLPDMARMLGRMMNEFKRATQDFTASLNETKDQTRNFFEETERQLRSAPRADEPPPPPEETVALEYPEHHDNEDEHPVDANEKPKSRS